MVVAPFSGTAAAISLVPDPVFSSEMVGPGIALVPDPTLTNQVVHAPVTGVVGALFPHAFAIETDNGVGVLVHLGIDTVALGGKGFKLLVSSGQFVTAGDPLIEWDPAFITAQGKSTMCPVVFVQQSAQNLTVLAEPGQEVSTGDPIVSWHG